MRFEFSGHGTVVPVIVLNRTQDALPLARALLDGGVRLLEITLRTRAPPGRRAPTATHC